MRTLIGVTPLWDVDRDSVWMLPDYLEGIKEAGGVPVVLPFDSSPDAIDAMVECFDGFLFTGGQDISPALYGMDDMDGKIVPCPRRDELEAALLLKVVEADKPVFGICRGLQLINAVLGGTLYRDLPTEHPSDIVHRQAKPYGRPTHTVRVSGPLRDLLDDLTEADVLPVNTLHHQAIKDLAPGLKPMAVTPDGLTEAFYAPAARFLWAVQWHPEYLFRSDAPSRRLFARFVKACEDV